MSQRQEVPWTPIKRRALPINEVKSICHEKICRSCPFLCLPLWKALHTVINNNITTSRGRVGRNLTGRGVWVFNGHHLLCVDKLQCLTLKSRRSVTPLAGRQIDWQCLQEMFEWCLHICLLFYFWSNVQWFRCKRIVWSLLKSLQLN